MLINPLQWLIFLFCFNELPFLHVFTELGGTTNNRDSCTGLIGKQLEGCVSEWVNSNFKNIPIVHFSDIPQSVVDDLSSVQLFAYGLSMVVMVDSMDEIFYFLEVARIVHHYGRLCFAAICVKNTPANIQVITRFYISAKETFLHNLKVLLWLCRETVTNAVENEIQFLAGK